MCWSENAPDAMKHNSMYFFLFLFLNEYLFLRRWWRIMPLWETNDDDEYGYDERTKKKQLDL